MLFIYTCHCVWSLCVSAVSVKFPSTSMHRILTTLAYTKVNLIIEKFQ